MRTITDIITLLLLTACGGHVQYADRQEATGADMIATLREVCGRYVGTDSPDSVTLAAILRLPDINRRGIPEYIDVIGPDSVISEERIGLLNIVASNN